MVESKPIVDVVRTVFENDPDLPRDARVTVAIPDATRPLSYSDVLAPLVAELHARGCDVSILVALGLHRPMTSDELRPVTEIAREYGAVLRQHDTNTAEIVCREDPPSVFPRCVVEADALVALGTVEPHQYAGFSGGAKTFAVGCAGVASIRHMHSFDFLRDPSVQVGEVDQNSFQQTLWRMVEPLPALYGAYVVPHGFKRAWAMHVGPARDAFRASVECALEHHFMEVEVADWMRLQVPQSKASSFYQASRAATYAALVSRPGIRAGGWLLIEAACPEGIGRGAGERACARTMRRGVEILRQELRQTLPTPRLTGGEQRAYVLARALERAHIALVGAREVHAELDAMGIPQFASLDEALSTLGLEPGRGLNIERPFHQVPIAGN